MAWARGEALPQIARLADRDANSDAFALATEVEGVIPDDNYGAEDRNALILVIRIHRSLSVARPSRAKSIDKIQNRTMTVFSFHPLSSK